MTDDQAIAHAFSRQAVHYLRDDFLPRIRRCAEELNAEDIWWRPGEQANSIGNLLLHLSGNVRQWIIAGLGGAPDHRQRDLEFSERNPLSSAQLLEQLESTVEEACRVIETVTPEALLQSRRIQKYEVTGLQAVFHVVEHFSHHTGQIIYITRQLKNTDLRFYNL